MSESSTTGIDSRLASVLSYSLWWVTGVLFLILERRDRGVRFHAAQALVLFGAVSLVLVAVGAASAAALVISSASYGLLRMLGQVIWLGAAVLWIVLVLRAGRGETWRVPLVAALADGIVARTSS
ncbi:MAG: DUF4870 domain-containing protein [Vicinamibacterales bacterium]